MSKMNPRHLAFADEYLNNGFNATKAYMSVYKSVKHTRTAEVNGSKLLTNTKVITYLEEKQKELRLASKKTREDIIQDLTDVIDEYKLTGVFTNHTLKAIEILNKMMGWYEPDKVDVEHKGIVINMVQPKPRDNNGDGD